MQIWNRVSKPPASALRPITGGRLKGKTDISPQWRLQALTELFGACGDGWGYTIDRTWTEPGCDAQVFAFAKVSLWYTLDDGNKSSPVPGVGGAMLIEQEKRGLYANDEAFKMAVTDAISVAAKSLGVAADVYLGQWEHDHWADELPPPNPRQLDQLKRDWYALRHDDLAGMPKEEIAGLYAQWILDVTGKKFDGRLTREQYDACLAKIAEESDGKQG